MTITAPLAASLKAVGALMSDAHDPWWIIASAAVALHGADAGHVADVDVLLSTGDAMRLLPSIGIAPRPGSEHMLFRSRIFGTWDGAPLPVEFMAGLCRRSGTEWLPVQPATRERVEIDGVAVFVPGREALRRLLAEFGRPKDLDRARRLTALGR